MSTGGRALAAYYVQREKDKPGSRASARGSRQLCTLERQLCPFKRQKTIDFCLSRCNHLSPKPTKQGLKLSFNLRKLNYSPTINPLMEPQQVHTKRRYVRSGRSEDLINLTTGEIHGVATIHQVEEKDDAEFVKVFAAGVAASYELTKTAQRVFSVVLDQYQRTPMNRGFADAIDLFWFGEGIEGRDVGMSEKTFQRGLKELLERRFLYPKSPTSFWTNPALFFKGDRVMFVKEYRRRAAKAEQAHREEIEESQQIRLAK